MSSGSRQELHFKVTENQDDLFSNNQSNNLFETESSGNRIKGNSRGSIGSPLMPSFGTSFQKSLENSQGKFFSRGILGYNSNGFQLNNSKKRLRSEKQKMLGIDSPEEGEFLNKNNHLIKSNQIIVPYQKQPFDEQLLEQLKEKTSSSLNLHSLKPQKTNYLNNFSNNATNSFGSFGNNNQNTFVNFGNNNLANSNQNSNFLVQSNKFFEGSIDFLTNNFDQNPNIHFSHPSPCKMDLPKQDPLDHTKHELFSPMKDLHKITSIPFKQYPQAQNKGILSSSSGFQQPLPSNKSFSGSTTKPSSLSNDEEVQESLFHTESLSLLWGTKCHDSVQSFKEPLHDFSSFEGGVKHHLATSKRLLGESSFSLRRQYENSKINIQEEDKDGERSSRGLRSLSLKVKQIVVDKVQTSYKVVADLLVEELRSQTTNIKQEEVLKDEQNIKRRVYDALNVLIASKVIEKKGKTVKSCNSSHLNGRCLQADNWKNVKHAENALNEKKKQLKEKSETLRDYVRKYLAFKNLIQRNQRAEQEKAAALQQLSQKSVDFLNSQDNTFLQFSQKSNPEQQSLSERILIEEKDFIDSQKTNGIFRFPFIIAQMPVAEKSRVIVKMNKENNCFKIFSSSKMVVNSELDVLIRLNLHKVDYEFASLHLDRNFYPSYFIDNPFFDQDYFQQIAHQQNDNQKDSNNNNHNNNHHKGSLLEGATLSIMPSQKTNNSYQNLK